jgi:hypothetical protein
LDGWVLFAALVPASSSAIGACTAGNPAPERPVARGAQAVAQAVPVTEVRLAVPTVGAGVPRAVELRGLLAASMELGLADLPGVVPSVGGARSPVFQAHAPAAQRMADATVKVRGDAAAIEIEMELCVAGGACTTLVGTGTRDAPWPAIATILEGAAGALGAEAPGGADWARPGSKDPYAETITGRGAAILWGLLPPPEEPGDPARDPFTRAVFLDPGQPLAHWLKARWEVSASARSPPHESAAGAPPPIVAPGPGDAPTPAESIDAALQRAILLRPWSPLLVADRATWLTDAGRGAEAALAWEDLVARSPADPRWIEPCANALAAVGQWDGAEAMLTALPAEAGWTAGVAALRVEVAEHRAPTEDLDPLLERWQVVDSRAAEPVRRRLDARVARGRYAEARLLVPVLAGRVPGGDVEPIDVALLVALGDLGAAADRAGGEVAVRIRSRALTAASPAERPSELPADDVEGQLAAAAAALWSGEWADVISLTAGTSKLAPARAEPWIIRARALERLGDAAAASDAWLRGWELDPAIEGGPVEFHRVASTFRFVETTGVPEDEGAVEAGERGPEM